jgi:hypothetical protein
MASPVGLRISVLVCMARAEKIRAKRHVAGAGSLEFYV